MTASSPSVGGAERERADDVVGLVAGDLDQRDAKAVEQGAHALDGAIEIRLQFVVEFFAGGLVFGVLGSAKGIAGIVDPDEVVGPVLLPQAQQEVGDAPDGRGVFASCGAQRTRDQRKERPIDQGVAVDQEELGRLRARPSTKDNAPRGSAVHPELCWTRTRTRSKSDRDCGVSWKRPKPVMSWKYRAMR